MKKQTGMVYYQFANNSCIKAAIIKYWPKRKAKDYIKENGGIVATWRIKKLYHPIYIHWIFNRYEAPEGQLKF